MKALLILLASDDGATRRTNQKIAEHAKKSGIYETHLFTRLVLKEQAVLFSEHTEDMYAFEEEEEQSAKIRKSQSLELLPKKIAGLSDAKRNEICSKYDTDTYRLDRNTELTWDIAFICHGAVSVNGLFVVGNRDKPAKTVSVRALEKFLIDFAFDAGNFLFDKVTLYTCASFYSGYHSAYFMPKINVQCYQEPIEFDSIQGECRGQPTNSAITTRGMFSSLSLFSNPMYKVDVLMWGESSYTTRELKLDEKDRLEKELTSWNKILYLEASLFKPYCQAKLTSTVKTSENNQIQGHLWEVLVQYEKWVTHIFVRFLAIKAVFIHTRMDCLTDKIPYNSHTSIKAN